MRLLADNPNHGDYQEWTAQATDPREDWSEIQKSLNHMRELDKLLSQM